MQRVRTSKQWFAVIAAGLALAGAVAVAAPKAGSTVTVRVMSAKVMKSPVNRAVVPGVAWAIASTRVPASLRPEFQGSH